MEEARAEARRWSLTYRRPWGWWHYDAPERSGTGPAAEVRVLAETGELLPEEWDALLALGTAARDRLGTTAEECYLCDGPGHGPDANRAAIADVLEEVGE